MSSVVTLIGHKTELLLGGVSISYININLSCLDGHKRIWLPTGPTNNKQQGIYDMTTPSTASNSIYGLENEESSLVAFKPDRFLIVMCVNVNFINATRKVHKRPLKRTDRLPTEVHFTVDPSFFPPHWQGESAAILPTC